MKTYLFNIDDYTASTRHLSLIEDSIYRRMIDLYYLKDGKLTSDVKQIARLTGAQNHAQEIESIIADFFEVSGEYLKHKRCDLEINSQEVKALASLRAPTGKNNEAQVDSFSLTSPDKPQKEKRKAEAKPNSLSDVVAYMSEQGASQIEAEAFYDYYSANGWVVGKAKAQMKDWKAAVRNWLKNTHRAHTTQQYRGNDYDERGNIIQINNRQTHQQKPISKQGQAIATLQSMKSNQRV